MLHICTLCALTPKSSLLGELTVLNTGPNLLCQSKLYPKIFSLFDAHLRSEFCQGILFSKRQEELKAFNFLNFQGVSTAFQSRAALTV